MRCRADSAQTACPWRHEAVRKGALWYSYEMHGWLYTSAIGVPVPITHCLSCAGTLPTLEGVVRRIIESDDEC